MKIKARRRFKEDYTRIEARFKKPAEFRKAFFRAVSMIRQGKDLQAEYTVNRITDKGTGWYDCYIYADIVMIYKIEGQYIKLSRLGTPKDLEKEM